MKLFDQAKTMAQYALARSAHPATLVAMRVGDFYEFYNDDAILVARELEITLTGREISGEGRIPMSGVPFHSVEKYLAILVEKGYRVTLCDDPTNRTDECAGVAL